MHNPIEKIWKALQKGRGIDNPCNVEEDKGFLAELLFHSEKRGKWFLEGISCKRLL